MSKKQKKEFQNTFEKPKPPNWRAGCPLARATGTLKGDPFRFLNIVAKHQKLEGELFGDFFSKKSLTLPKKLKEGTPGIVCYAENEKLFWFVSLGQMIQFGTIKFHRT